MNYWNNDRFAAISTLLAEDVNAPELRNPRSGALRSRGLLARLLGRKA